MPLQPDTRQSSSAQCNLLSVRLLIASGRTFVAVELRALASFVFVIEKSFGVVRSLMLQVAASLELDLGMAALTILTDFCLSVSEGDGLTGVVMSSSSAQCAVSALSEPRFG